MTDRQREIEQVAAGLQAMQRQPDYLICRDGGERLEFICGVRIIYAELIAHPAQDCAVSEPPFIPAWALPAKDDIVDVARFMRGFDEH